MSRRSLLVSGCILAAVAAGIGVLRYEAIGDARRTSRLSSMHMLRHEIERHLKLHGRYPVSLDEMEGEDWRFLRSSTDFSTIEYVATGKAASGHDLLFYERTPKRYGFTSGRFKVYEDRIVFVKGDTGPGV